MDQPLDGQLLEDVAANASEASFEELVRRHAGMAYNECRRLFVSTHDAEDAAQAVFLVLWKKAAHLSGRESVAAWLHRVARNVCRNAQRARAIRQHHEQQSSSKNALEQIRTEHSNELEIRAVLDEELDRLPEKYRLPLILFHLEGRSMEEIAAMMSLKTATVGTRLGRGRDMLRSRLVRRGVGVSAGALAAALSAEATAALLPEAFVATTAQTASLFATGTIATGIGGAGVSAQSAALANGAMHMLTITKIKVIAAAVLAASLVGGGFVAAIVSAQPSLSPVQQQAAVATPKDLAALIAKVRENEALFRNLDVTVKSSYRPIFAENEQKPNNQGKIDFGRPVFRESEETSRLVTQGDRYSLTTDMTVSHTTGFRATRNRRIVYDGNETIAIDEGNSATLFHGRYDPPVRFPQINWERFLTRINFPLSVYLQGSEALEQIRKHSAERGLNLDTQKLESIEVDLLGEEMIGSLSCVKVRIRRTYANTSDPFTQHFLLAKDRNYHVVECRGMKIDDGQEIQAHVTRVTEWREVADSVWLPAAGTYEVFRLDEFGHQSQELQQSRQFRLESAVLNPELPEDFFKLPEIPALLPRFVVGADGHLVDSPQHLRPVQADPGTTLDSILDRLAVEEAKYDQIDAEFLNRYETDPILGTPAAGIFRSTEEHVRSLVAGGRRYYRRKETAIPFGAPLSTIDHEQAYDGQWFREISKWKWDPDREPQLSASLGYRYPGRWTSFRAHTLFWESIPWQSLSGALKSGWFDLRLEYPMQVQYVEDEEAGGLHCHKLRCEMAFEGVPKENRDYFFVWLARDRNLIPIRLEWFQPKWFVGLPNSMNYVDVLREIRPGVWFPYRVIKFGLNTPHEGLRTNRPLVGNRSEITVTSLKLNPTVDDAIFSNIEVPVGTVVSVQDENGEGVGRFNQPETGPLNLSDEKYQEMVETSRREKAEKEKAETGTGQQ